MTKNNHQEKSQKLAEQLFCVNAAYTSLVNRSRHNKQEDNASIEVNSIVVFNDIFQLVKGNHQAHFIERSPLIIKKINADIRLRKIYIQLINQLTFAQSGLQVAASSGDVLADRITDNFSIKFKRDKNQPNQVYVILAINNPAEHHFTDTLAVHITNNNQVECLYFPVINDGRSQLLMEDKDSRFKVLTDANSELYLM